MLKLYYGDVGALDPWAAWEGFSAYRLERLSGVKSDRARRQGIGAELLLLEALKREGEGLCLPPDIGRDPGGKPFLRFPGLYFSVAHSENLSVCALADSPLGADVQKRRKMNPALVRRFFSQAEQRFLLDEERGDDAFSMIWSLKEAFLKADGLGLRRPLSSFCVIPDAAGELPPGFWHERKGDFHMALFLPGRSSAKPDMIKEITLL